MQNSVEGHFNLGFCTETVGSNKAGINICAKVTAGIAGHEWDVVDIQICLSESRENSNIIVYSF